MFDDPDSILRDLRWKEDMKVINPFGEHVWLKPYVKNGQRIGITDCCFVSEPCSHHKTMQHCEDLAKNN